MAGSVLLLLFSLYLIVTSNNKPQAVGGAYVSVSAIFMALIGIFHEGTSPHVFVSAYFFVQFFAGVLVYGLGRKERILRHSSILLFLQAIAGTLLPWPATALLETYEVALLMVFTLLVAFKPPNNILED